MKLGDRVVDGIFLERPNRYLARVEIDGQEIKAHVPDPGRLPGLMTPGRRVRLIYNPGPKRKTDYSLVLVRHGTIWVSVYPVFANKVVEKELAEGNLSCLNGYKKFNREVKCGESRFDFQLEFLDVKAFVEVKSVVLFVSQRSDARSIISNDQIDPLFGEWLRKAHLASVELYAYNCRVTKNTVSIKNQIPVNI